MENHSWICPNKDLLLFYIFALKNASPSIKL